MPRRTPSRPRARATVLVLGLIASVLAAGHVAAAAPAAAAPPVRPVVVLLDALPASAAVDAPVVLRGRARVADGLVTDLLQLLGLVGRQALTATLELHTAAGWHPVGSTSAAADGSFRLTAPTWFYGTHTLRVSVAPTEVTAAAYSPEVTLAVPPPYDPRGSAAGWRLLEDEPTRWDPCQPIPYEVNLRGAPRGALRTVQEALRRVRQATGLTFSYTGRSRTIPWGAVGRSRSITPDYGFAIAWSTPRRVPGIAGRTVALAGSSVRSVHRDGRWSRAYFTGGLVIDRTQPLAPGFRRGASLGFVLLHEIGHILGLDHVDDPAAVMHASVSRRSVPHFSAGDLAALARLGLASGCL